MGDVICPECGAAWPADLDMAYCGKCGTEFDPSIPEITDKERRTLTVLFADLSGYTSFSEGNDPERVETLIDDLLTDLGNVVEAYGGYVDKYIGDAIMAVFGAPEAHEDAQLRAVQAGFEMLQNVEEFNAELDDYDNLGLSVGINHGEVIWSRVGGRDYTVTGDAVNVAQRLEAEADENTVLVSRAVEQRTNHEVRYTLQSSLDVEGRTEPVQSSVAVDLRAGSTEPVEQVRRQSPLLGRNGELEQVIARYEDGTARFVAITGEAGIGKSRLVRGFREWLGDRADEPSLVAGQCSHHADLPLEPFAEYLLTKAETGRGDPDAGETVSKAILGDLAGSDLTQTQRENVAHLLAVSAGLDVPDARVTDLDPEQLQEAIHDAWVTWLRVRARETPVVIELEDLHWADEATTALLTTLQDRLTALAEEFEHSVTVLATARPQWDVPDWIEELELTPLAESDVRAIAEALVEGPIDDEVSAFLTEKTGGNPYFLEEVIRYLLDRDLLIETASGHDLAAGTGEAVTVPETLNGLLTGRIDALPTTAGETLKGASVVGQRFWVELLGSTLNHEVDEEIGTLVARELVYPRPESALPADDEYAFIHALLRDAAYELLPKAARRDLHGSVADALVAKLGGENNPLASLVAHHTERAGQYDRAFRFYRQAGDSADDSYANNEAISAYERAIALTAEDEDVATDAEIASVYADLAGVYNTISAPEQADEAVEAGLAVAASDSEARCLLLGERVTALETQSAYDEAIETATEQLELAASLGRRSLEADALDDLATVASRRGSHDQAIEYAERSRTLCEEIGDREGEASALNKLGVISYRRGNYEQGREYFERSLTIDEDIGNRQGHAQALNNLGTIAKNRGNYERAIECYERSLAIHEDIGNRRGQAQSLNNLGAVAFSRGDYDQALEYFEGSVAIREDIGDRQGQAQLLNNLGDVAFKRGDYDQAEDYLERSLAIKETIGDQRGQAPCLANLGRVARNRGNYKQAREYFDQSLAILEDSGNRPGQVRLLNHLAAVERQQLNYEASRSFLERADDVLAGLDDIMRQITHDRERAALAREARNYDRARSHLEDALVACDAADSPRVELSVHLERTRLALARQDSKDAQEALEQATDLLDDLDIPLEAGRAALLAGRIAVETGETNAASTHFEEALSTFEEIGARPDALETLEQLIDLARAEDDTGQARTWCQQARDLLDEASEELAEIHHEWIDRHTSELGI